MTKKDIIRDVSLKTNVPKPTVSLVLHATLDSIGDALMRGHRVDLRLFGNFIPVMRKGKGRNIQKNEIMKLDSFVLPKFRASKYLKAKINLTK